MTARHDIALDADESQLITALDSFSQTLQSSGRPPVELRIAGGWVRDKLLGLPSSDLDVAVSSMTGYDFATQFAAYVDSKHSKNTQTKVACIGANPEQSKHLETATAPLFNRDIDFVQLRSEEYGTGSRIPSEVVRWTFLFLAGLTTQKKFGTPLEDALRRDLTINALFYNVHSRNVEDWTNKGLDDLLKKPLIQCPLPPFQTFLDDPLRILRCIRFAGRFGFPLHASISEEVAKPEIKHALQEKVSKERVLIELNKMLLNPFALHAIRLIHSLGLHSSIFFPRFETLSPLPSPAESASAALFAAETVGRFLPPPELRPTKHQNVLDAPASRLQGLHPLLQKEIDSSSPDLRRRLYLASQLIPLNHNEARDKKKAVPTIDKFLRTGLVTTNHDRTFVLKLYQASSLIQAHTRDLGPAASRVQLGQLLRQPCVQDSFTGPTWPISIFYSCLLEVYSCLREASEDALPPILERYRLFVDQIISFDLPRDAFDKPVLDGNEVVSILGFHPGADMSRLMDRVVAWQLEHPGGSKYQCRSWLSTQWESGKLDVTKPEDRPKKIRKQ